MNWIGWFALGILIREKNWLERVVSWQLFVVVCPLLIALVALSTSSGGGIDAYVNSYAIPIEVAGVICIMFLAKVLSASEFLQDLGRKTFFIYLAHIHVAGIVNTHLPYNAVFFVARPIVVVLICYIVAKLLEWVLQKTRCSDTLGKILALR